MCRVGTGPAAASMMTGGAHWDTLTNDLCISRPVVGSNSPSTHFHTVADSRQSRTRIDATYTLSTQY